MNWGSTFTSSEMSQTVRTLFGNCFNEKTPDQPRKYDSLLKQCAVVIRDVSTGSYNPKMILNKTQKNLLHFVEHTASASLAFGLNSST